MKTAEEVAEEIRRWQKQHEPNYEEFERYLIKNLNAFAEERVKEVTAKLTTECESFHANNDDVRILTRAEALEEAAKVVEKLFLQALGQNEEAEKWLAAKIRALKEDL